MSAPLAPLSRWNTYSRSRYSRLWDGVVGSWCPSLGITGSRLFDAAPFSNWGTMTNMDPATDWIVHDGQLCLDFDGSNDHVNFGRPNQIDPIIDNFTVSVWCRPTAFYNFANVVGKADNTAGQFGVIINFAGFWSCQFGTASNVNGSTLALNTWYMLSYTLFQGTVVTYTNGVVSATGSNTTNVRNVDLTIGGDVANGRYFTGQIDDFQFRNRAINASEMLQLYRLGRGGIYQPAYRPSYYMEPDAGGGGITSRPYAWQSARMIGAGR